MGPVALPPVETVENAAHRGIGALSVRASVNASSEPVEWSQLSSEARLPRRYFLDIDVPGDAGAVRIPVCAGRGLLSVDDARVVLPDGPAIVPLQVRPPEAWHHLVLRVDVSGYEKRIACGEPIIAGARTPATVSSVRGILTAFDFPSPHAAAGGGHAVVYIPPGHDMASPGAMLVGLHPWNGTIWTYAAYQELLSEAATHDVVLLLPSSLGNSLTIAPAEDETMRAIAALEDRVAIDPQRVSIWGASMGGAGATTVGFHHPDKFARITSFFGDSDYDIRTYVHSILHYQAGAHRVNALDVADNARNVPVWLIHGTADKVSSIVQSERLDAALRQRQFSVRFDRVEGLGHEGPLVARFLREVVDNAATDHAPAHPSHVTFVSVRAEDRGAYGVHFTKRTASLDARIDVVRTPEGIRLIAAENVRKLSFDSGALGSLPGAHEAVHRDPGVPAIEIVGPP